MFPPAPTFPKWSFPSCFPANILYAFLISLICAACPPIAS
jgi:hypothetical protein